MMINDEIRMYLRLHPKWYLILSRYEKKLHDEKIVLLLSRHQMLQEDYLRVKQYQNYMTSDDLKEQLKEVKKELFEHPQIQSYYQSYYALNDLLEKVTEIIFQGISEELSFHQLTL